MIVLFMQQHTTALILNVNDTIYAGDLAYRINSPLDILIDLQSRTMSVLWYFIFLRGEFS